MPARYLTLFLIGVALSIAQFVMVRDFVSILYGEEIVIVLVTSTFFLGMSVGYVLSLRLSMRAFRRLFLGSVFIHLSFPFSYRVLAAYFAEWDLGGLSFLALLIVYALVFNLVFASFLPRLISDSDDDAGDGLGESQRLRSYYSLELAGFMTGFAIVALSWNRPSVFLLGTYWLILGTLLHLVLGRVRVTAVFAVLATTAVAFFGQIDRGSTALLYEHKHSVREPNVLYSINSPYQKVQVIEDRRGELFLYLDGLLNLNSGDLEDLNYYLAELPAVLVQPRKTLVIGNGTLSSVPKVYPHSGTVTSVELDGAVLEAGRRFFTDPAMLAGLDNWELKVDDGRHFLRKTEDRFDLIIVDVPSPLTIQEATMHTIEFYELADSRLTDTGVIAVQLSGPLSRNDRTPARVAGALAQVFPEVMVINSDKADRGFAYASRNLPFNGRQAREAAADYERGLDLIRPSQLKSYVDRAEPLSTDRMDLVLRRGWARFFDRYLRG
ncbi:MAG: hypothetical protein VX246_15885 [Myxococcota bacterium]|nr:hypothetical protein [Myxococcota bacterium]